MSGWRKCDTCRRVRTGAEFDGDATTCVVCLTKPAAGVRKRAAPVTRMKVARTDPAADAEQRPRKPLLGLVGSGDLEVRERRARRAAQDALAKAYPEDFAALLRDARQAEGLRPLSTGTAAAPADAEE